MDSLHSPLPPAARTILFLLLIPMGAIAGSWEVGYSFPAPTRQTNGLTFDGRYLWHSNDVRPVIYQINPVGGEVVSELPTTVRDQGELELGGGFLWVNSENDHYLLKMDPASGKTLDSILVLGIPPGNQGRNGINDVQLEGLAFDGKNIWVDGGSNRIIRIDPETKSQYMYVMPDEMGYLDGMTWAFDHLWIVTNNATIYEIDPCSMEILDKFDAPTEGGHGPEGFAFDGENLWFADNGIDMIYKIILKFRLMTKRSAAAKTGAAAACNPGQLLTPTVGNGRIAPAAFTPPARTFFSTPLFQIGSRSDGSGRSDKAGAYRFTDARGRIVPSLRDPGVAHHPGSAPEAPPSTVPERR